MDTSKIIKGVISNGRYTVTAPIVKEDYGLYLKIEGLELPSTYEVDFSNSESNGTSVTMIGNADGVLIPHQFIDTGKNIFAFLYHVGANYGRTVYKFRIPNKVRPDRTNEEPTPEEQSVIDQTISALNDAVEEAEGYAQTASDKAESIHDMTATAQTLPEGSEATASYNAETGVMSFGIPAGATGAQGDKGDKGDKGDTGAQGVKGDKGDKGDTGATGAKGDKGDKGEKGDRGEQGIQGPHGEQGVQGIQGPKGDKGDTGPQGPKGDDYTLTEQDKQDIAELVDIPESGMVVTATISGNNYRIDSTYDDIKSALSQGKTVVVMTQGVPQPYVGNVQLNGEWFLAFGVSTIYDNVATLAGFMIPETYQNVAVWTQQNTTIPQVNDVQINGQSIVSDGVANVPMASNNNLGAIKSASYGGIIINENGELLTNRPLENVIKGGGNAYRPIVPDVQHISTFYGLAKAAGDTTQSQSSNAVGTYTEEAKSAISEMLGGSVSVSGTTPTIVAKPGIRYVCGEVATLDFTPSATGICDVVFTSGSTTTVLTVPSTIKWANGFDPTSLDANTTYELNIMDGLGVACAWT